MSRMRHSRRDQGRGSAPRLPVRTTAAVLALAALCLWATVPYGAVAEWARASVILGALAASGACLLASRRRRIEPDDETAARNGGSLLRATLGALLVWSLVQLVPLPIALLNAVGPGVGYAGILPASAHAPLAFDRYRVLTGLAQWIAYAALAWGALSVLRSRGAMRLLCACLAASGTLQALAAVFGVTGEPPYPTARLGSRLLGTFSGSNAFGGFLMMSFLATLGLVLAVAPRIVEETKGRSTRILLSELMQRRELLAVLGLSLSLVVQAVAILLSGSRGAAVITAAAAGSLLAWFYGATRRDARGRAIKLLVPILLAVILLGTGGAYAVLATRLRALTADTETLRVARGLIWRASLALLARHPLGVGLSCFELAILRHQPPGFGDRRINHAHSDLLEFACELGLPGLLAIAALLLLLFRGTRSLRRDRPHGFSIWMWRAALAAVGAGLAHAMVDFNLSSRPGVAVTFMVLLGAALGYTRQATRMRRAQDRALLAVPPTVTLTSLAGTPPRAEGPVAARRPGPPERRLTIPEPPGGRPAGTTMAARPPRPSRALRAASAAGAVVLLVFSTAQAARTVAAAWLVETAYTALGGKADPYFWARPRTAAETVAPRLFDRARVLAPDWAWLHYREGRGRLEQAGRRRDRLLADGEAKTGTNLTVEARAAVEDAARPWFIDAGTAAARDFERALALSPWDADLHAATAWALFLAGAGQDDPAAQTATRGAALRQVRLAVALAPNDAAVLVHACVALAAGLVFAGPEDDRDTPGDLLRTLGMRVLEHDPSRTERILELWHAAGLQASAFLDENLPIRAIWAAYRLYDRDGQPEGAAACLRSLWRALEKPADTGTAGLEPEALARYRQLAVREQARGQIREQRWDDYRGMLARREEAHAARVNEQILALRKAFPSSEFLYIKLKDLNDALGLTAEQELTLCGMELDRRQPRLVSDLLASLALRAQEDELPFLRCFLKSHGGGRDETPGVRLARARCLLADGASSAADAVLADLAADRALPRRFLHRVHLLRGLTSAGTESDTNTAPWAADAAAACPTDPDALAAWLTVPGDVCRPVVLRSGDTADAALLYAQVTPAHRVQAYFLGRRAEFSGLSVSIPAEPANAPCTLHLFWRFWGNVPLDLLVSAVVSDASGSVVASRRSHFGREEPLRFGAGTPIVGSVIDTAFTFPRWVPDGTRLTIALRRDTDNRPIETLEGLRVLQIDGWSRLATGATAPAMP